jgi:hypothetical protein
MAHRFFEGKNGFNLAGRKPSSSSCGILANRAFEADPGFVTSS